MEEIKQNKDDDITQNKIIINNITIGPNNEEQNKLIGKNEEKIIKDKNKSEIRNSSVYEVLGIKAKDKKNYDRISSEFKKYEKLYKMNISYSNRNNLKFDSPLELSKIINILSLPPEKRTFDDIFLMKKYLLTTKIDNLFKDEFNNKEESIDKFLTFFSLEMRYKLFEKNEIVFKVGDLSVFLFLIIDGKVEILKPISEIKLMSGYEYFSYLLELKNNSEEYMLNLNIDENLEVYNVNKDDITQFSSIYLLNLLEKFTIYHNINFEEELEFINIDPWELGLEQEKIKIPEYIFLRLKQIKEKLPNISPDTIKKYKYVVDHNEKKQVKIYKYISFMKLENNIFFGESAMGENEKRNATVKVVEDSNLGYLSVSLYKSNFFAEKKLVIENKINFLHSRFFFKNIALKRFAKKYFNLFICDTYINGNIIFNESDPINYVYFIEEGLIELSSSKTILEIEIFLKGLENRITLNDETTHLNYKNISSNTDDLQEYLNKTQKNKILIVGKYEIIGLESFYYNIPYFTTARVTSNRAKVFKIDLKQLWQILNIEVDCIPELKNLVLNKTKILKKRFFGINDTRLTLIDEKINFDYKQEYFKILEKKKKSENEIEKTQKNNLIYNEIKVKTLFKSKTNRNYFIPIMTNEEKNAKKAQKKINYLSLLKNLNNFIEQDKGIISLKKRKDKKKISYIEDRLLNKVKSQIKNMNNNKYFLSQIKFPLKKQKSLDIIDENIDKKNSNNDLDISNSKEENYNLINIYSKKLVKNNLFDTQIQFNKSNNDNNSTSSILPSIFSLSPNHNKNMRRNFSLINDNKNNNHLNYDKNIYKNNLSPNYQRTKYVSFLSEKNNKTLCDKNFIGLNIKKFSNFYEIKNNFQKEKINFYNNSEIFGYRKKEELKKFEIRNTKQVNDDNFLKNMEIISIIKKKKKYKFINSK